MGIIRGIKYLFLASFTLFILYTLYYNISGEAFLPEGYYEAARNYAPKVEKHDRETLEKLLMNLTLPPYKMNYFDCSESSSFLEWYLEGAGFHTYIGASLSLQHAWVIVELDNGDWVAVEATMLTKNHYNPPGIIDAKNSYYYNPPKLYENPGQAISFMNDIKYPGYPKWTVDEIDWWNTEPFSEKFMGWK